MNDYIFDDYVEYVEDYAEQRGLKLFEDSTAEECAEHILSWCKRNNHDLDSIPMPEFELIIEIYYNVDHYVIY